MDCRLIDKITKCFVALGSVPVRWFIIAHCFSLLLELVLLRHQSDQAKDLQILLLRRQLEIVQRKLDKPLRVSHAEKFSLALLTGRLKGITRQPVWELGSVNWSPKMDIPVSSTEWTSKD